MARKKCVLIGHLSAFQDVFQKAADLSQGDIEIIKRIDYIGLKEDEEVLVELDLCAGVDCIVIEPFLYHNGDWVNRTSLITSIKHLFPQANILAIAIDTDSAPKCYDKGATMFLAYDEISASQLVRLTSILINPESRPPLTYTHLRLLPKGYRIEVTGRTKTGKIAVATVSLSSAPAMRQIYFLSLQRFLNQAGWWKYMQLHDYLCLQRRLWDMLEIAIPRKPRGHVCDGWVICSSLREAVGLVTSNGASSATPPDNIRREELPLIKDGNELSQMSSHVNKPVENSFFHYQCEDLIIGPSRHHTSYGLNETILAKNISFDLQNQ